MLDDYAISKNNAGMRDIREIMALIGQKVKPMILLLCLLLSARDFMTR